MVQVKNAPDTSECSSIGFTSWIKFWNSNRPNASKCQIKYCSKTENLVGAHVEVEGKSGLHIIPMCRSHNSSSNTDWMETNANTNPLKIPRGVAGDNQMCFH